MTLRHIARSALLAAALSCISLGAPCPPLPSGAERIGFVTAVQGDWRVDLTPPAAIGVGCDLAPGWKIVGPPKSASHAKLAWIDRVETMHLEACRAGQDCRPVHLPVQMNQATPFFKAVLEELMRKLRGGPEKFANAIGLGDGRLRDCIVTTADTSLAPGLYRLNRVDADSKSDAWILVLRPGPAADGVREKAAQLQARTSKWEKEQDLSTEARNNESTLFRAFLATQAESLSANPQ